MTGASSGIGGSFARLLAERQHDLVVVARNRERLEQLASELRSLHKVDVEVLVADLSKPDQLGQVEGRLMDTDSPVAVLVNNAGYGSSGDFAELPIDGEVAEIAVNVLAVVRLTHAALSTMIPAGSGAILNVSSLGGFIPSPKNATYSATKAFVLSFTEAVHEEVVPHRVKVSCLCPGFTRTEFQERANVSVSGLPGFVWMDAQSVVKAGLSALDRNQAICIPGLHNKAATNLVRFAPRSVVRQVSGSVMRHR